MFLFFECLQAVVDFFDHIADPWNYIDLSLVIVQTIMAALYWSEQPEDAIAFFTSFSLVLVFTKVLIAMRVFDQLRYLIRMILEILRNMISFMVVIIAYIISFTLVMYQSRNGGGSADGGDFDSPPSFGATLLEMYTLIYGAWDNGAYVGTTMPFFILVTFFQALVLLNLIIAIMGDTYGKVMDNLPTVDARERLSLIAEVCILKVQLKNLRTKLFGQKKAIESEDPERVTGNKKILLVIEPFEYSDEADDSSELTENIKALQKNFDKSIDAVKLKVEKFSGKKDMEHNFLVLSKEMQAMKSDIAQTKSDIAETKTSHKEIIAKLDSLDQLLKNLQPPQEVKQEK